MSMLKTALRSSARAAGALSASSRIASVRSTTTQWQKSFNGARNGPHTAQRHLYTCSGPFPAMSRASGKLLAMASSSEVAFRDGALTSRRFYRSNEPHPPSSTPSPAAMPPTRRRHRPRCPPSSSRGSVGCRKRLAWRRQAVSCLSGRAINTVLLLGRNG